MKTDFRLTRIACHIGIFTQAIIINLAAVFFIVFHEAYGVSFQNLGFLVFAAFVTPIFMIVFVVNNVYRLGYLFFSILGNVLAVIGLVLLGILPNIMGAPYAGLMISVIIYSAGGGTVEAVANPLVNALPANVKSASLNLLHSFYSWGHVSTIVGTTLLLQLVGRDQWFIIPMLWAIIPLVNIFIFAKAPMVDTVPEKNQIPVKHLLSSRIFILLIIMIIFAGAAEQVIAQWVSLFAEEGLRFPKVLGDLLGPGLFACLMGASRLIQSYSSQKKSYRLNKSMFQFIVICVICYIVVVSVRQPLITLLACAACGFFIATIWPSLLALNGQAFPFGGAVSFGILTIFGSLGSAVGPLSAGFISDHFGLQIGLLTGLVFSVLMLITFIVFRRTNRNSEALT